MSWQLGGSTRITTDTAITTEPTRVWNIFFLSSATAATIRFRNGGSTGSIYVQKLGTANDGTSINFAKGLFFPSGLYYTHDSNTTFTVVEYEIEK